MRNLAISAFLLWQLVGSPAAAETVAIVNGKIVTSARAGTLDRATVIVRDGKIVKIDTDANIPAKARVIDANGKWVTPGLFDPASQIGLNEVVAFANASDATARDSVFTAGFEVHYGIDPDVTWVAQARSEGITSAAVMPSSGAGIFSGLGALITTAPVGDAVTRKRALLMVEMGTTGATNAGGARGSAWVGLREAFRLAQSGKAPIEGETSLKHADLEAIRLALKGAIPLIVHVERAADIRLVLDLRHDLPSLDIVLLGVAEAWQVADEIAAAGVPVILSPFENLPTSFEKLSATRRNASLLSAAGAQIAFMPDTRPDLPMVGQLRQAAGVAVAYGLDWDEAVRAITVTPARIFGVGDESGSIEAGKSADIVIWDGDPLELSSAPTVVLINGTEVGLGTRQGELLERYR